MCNEQQFIQSQARATPREFFEAAVRMQELDEATAEMTVHVIEFPDRVEPGVSS